MLWHTERPSLTIVIGHSHSSHRTDREGHQANVVLDALWRRLEEHRRPTEGSCPQHGAHKDQKYRNKALYEYLSQGAGQRRWAPWVVLWKARDWRSRLSLGPFHPRYRGLRSRATPDDIHCVPSCVNETSARVYLDEGGLACLPHTSCSPVAYGFWRTRHAAVGRARSSRSGRSTSSTGRRPDPQARTPFRVHLL